MKALKSRLPLTLILSKVLIVSLAVAAHAQAASAQELKQDLHHDLSYCAKQLNYTPVQLLQLNHLKQEEDPSQQARFQDYLKILTPTQQQQLAQCTKAEMKHSIAPH